MARNNGTSKAVKEATAARLAAKRARIAAQAQATAPANPESVQGAQPAATPEPARPTEATADAAADAQSVQPVSVSVELQEPKPETLRGPGRPRKDTTIREPGARRGLQPGQERFTVVGETELLNKLRDYAYTERITLKAALDRAIRLLLKTAAEQGKEILERPKS